MGVKSPLRICPLGAHVDHQNGLIAGLALNESINMVYSANREGYIRIQSMDFPDEEYFHIDRVPDMLPGFWGNYIRGSVLSLGRYYKLKYGLNGVISGKIPIGGLSSSAAVTTAYLMALCDVNEIELTKEELIQFSHWVETDFIGLQNGILDQAANILSRENMLMFMDCKSKQYKLIHKSDKMPDFEVIVVYSGVTKSLISTDYNHRVDECKIAASILEEIAYGRISGLKKIKLRDVEEAAYYRYREKLPGRFRRRADHFYSENERVLKGVQSWAEGDIVSFGKLMFESGDSSIYNYECGCPELITIYGILKDSPGVFGARFSGAGYRGCCIGLIDPSCKKNIKDRLDRVYPVKHPEYAESYQVYFCKTDNGARMVKL